eukprot:CAMPEP_0202687436 /NCGR_PEP_ID=MMETSP1385-20130828/3115_1 /ASSEMBLY_ACC=CAM_ASM_000861 /TAXON_ID=933848 /ORGANISM="Elphidium margaritaceum" /LENGTH=637 /DNA_ID=CAMNT_0049342223 /DNA_START=49 /DNA_END=1959 /DNA_ORIENTATION=-
MAYNPNALSQAATQSHLKEKVELFISCSDLVEKDLNSKSDPFVVIYQRNKAGQWAEVSRTEALQDTSYPTFSTSLKIDYFFEEEQLLRFDVYDEDKKGSQRLKDHDFVGSANFPLGELMHEKGQVICRKLMCKGGKIKNKKSKRYSSITVTAEKVAGTRNEVITMQFIGKGLPKMDGMFGKSDPYFTISRVREDNKAMLVYKSEVIKSNLNPAWKALTIDAQKLCNCDAYRPLIIEVYDWDKNSSDDIIGRVETNLNELRGKPQGMKLTRATKSGKTFGDVSVASFTSKPLASFVDYLQGGAEISLLCAIDFTGSNGDPRQAPQNIDGQIIPASLHYLTPQQPSQYQQAIRQIGNIVSVYDFDKKFPVWGFGGWFKQTGIVRHDFALNWNDGDPEVSAVFGIEQAYVNAIGVVKTGAVALSGPTLFEPVLRKASIIADMCHKKPGLQYLILLILTDGIINDMKQTRDLIVDMANRDLPISIIIVGIGGADFSAMNELDGDGQGLMNSKGQRAKRDIVQFVPIRKYQRLSELSKETLIEIPQQFLSYTKAHGVAPGQKAQIETQSLVQAFQISDAEMKQEDDMGMLPSQQPPSGGAQVDQFANAPLPPGWERGYTDEGQVYYVNNQTHTTQWEFPMLV